MLQTQSLLWLCVAAYGVHILEEFVFDWENWARNVLRLPVQWNGFYGTNALVIVLGIVAAEIAPVWPVAALAYPALVVINASFFHVPDGNSNRVSQAEVQTLLRPNASVTAPRPLHRPRPSSGSGTRLVVTPRAPVLRRVPQNKPYSCRCARDSFRSRSWSCCHPVTLKYLPP